MEIVGYNDANTNNYQSTFLVHDLIVKKTPVKRIKKKVFKASLQHSMKLIKLPLKFFFL